MRLINLEDCESVDDRTEKMDHNAAPGFTY